jgi:hypothetical protein
MLILNQKRNSDLKPNFGYKSRFRTTFDMKNVAMGGKVSAGRLQRSTARRRHGSGLPCSGAPVVHDVVHARGAPCASLRVVSTIKSLQKDFGEI